MELPNITCYLQVEHLEFFAVLSKDEKGFFWKSEVVETNLEGDKSLRKQLPDLDFRYPTIKEILNQRKKVWPNSVLSGDENFINKLLYHDD
jgi:hypothetical protein